MDEKSLNVLEYPKVLDMLAGYTSFSASHELALAQTPSTNLENVLLKQRQTSEVRRLLDTAVDFSIGGAHDIRPLAELAARGGVLTATELLDVKATLISARNLSRTMERQTSHFPELCSICARLVVPPGIVEAISRIISERGEVLDSASEKLRKIRVEVRSAHEKILSKLQRMVTDQRSGGMLQEAIITQRDGRYVIPLRSEFKGQIKSIVHDQSASGATLFVEPLVVVELNNHWKELQLQERDEERRVLAEVSTQIGEHHQDLIWIVENLAELDLITARGCYAEEQQCTEPIILPFKYRQDEKHPGSVIRFFKARHPLLDPATVVPIEFDLDEDTYTVVITGPNTGGKTVTLKTVGLLVLMAQTGLHIPVLSGSEMTLFENVFADIGDEQSIEQSLSTFSGHIRNINHILQGMTRKSLVLLDELGAGTDPQEGAALARAILAYLLNQGVTSLIATHYPELKVFAHTTKGVINASLEFDLRTLKPTYRLSLGLPGRSNALAIAERLGLPAGIIHDARGEIHPDELKAEHLLDEIYRQRARARHSREKADSAKKRSEERERKLNSRLEQIEDERRKILEDARNQAAVEIDTLNKEITDLKKDLLRARQPLDALKDTSTKVDELEEKALRPVVRKHTPASARGPIKPGDKVLIISLNMEGLVSSISEEEAEVQIGNLRVKARLTDLKHHKSPTSDQTTESSVKAKRAAIREIPAGKTAFPSAESPGMELDIRGQRVEDALAMLERYLESASLSGMPFVRIIHGKGTGVLRSAVREQLKDSPYIFSHQSGQEKEGGDGVTVAFFHKD